MTAIFLLLGARAMGLEVYDETAYLDGARRFNPGGFLHSQAWSPLYALYYRVLAVVCPDPLARYFLSWRVLAATVALLPPLLRMREGYLHTLLMIALPLTLMTPRVALFAGVLLLSGICLLLKRPRASFSDAIFLYGAFTFVSAFARPEFNPSIYLALPALLLALGVELTRKSDPARRRLGRLLGAAAKLVLLLTFAWAMHFATSHSSNAGRLSMAFVQHFNLRAKEHGLIPQQELPFASHYAQNQFGLDQDRSQDDLQHPLKDYFRARPRLFLGHIAENLIDPRTVVFVLSLAGTVLWPWFDKRFAALRPASLFLAGIALPPLGGIVLIYPRDHYAIIVVPSLTILGLRMLRPSRWILGSPANPRPILQSAGILTLLVCLCVGITWYRLSLPLFPWQRATLASAECVRRIDAGLNDPNPAVFDVGHALSVYVPHPRISTEQWDLTPWPRFTAWALRTHPAWITMNPETVKLYAMPASEIDRFLTHDLGYTRHACPAGASMTVYTNPHP